MLINKKDAKMKKYLIRSIYILITLIFSMPSGYCQNVPEKVAGIPVNYDETLSGTYTLPDPLIFPDGRKVKSARQWYKERRPQIVSLFEENEYGKVPEVPEDLKFDIFDNGTPALNGKAIRKQVTVYLTKDTSVHKMDILIYLPAGAVKPVPVFFNVSFSPNASVVDDPGIRAGYMWDRDGKRVPVKRSGGFGRMDPNIFLSQGIGFATVYYGDIEPDFAEG